MTDARYFERGQRLEEKKDQLACSVQAQSGQR
jgi:hypothetical protein